MLKNRNVVIAGSRTTMRLEPEMWEALTEICHRENLSLHEICTLVDARKRNSSLTSAVRVFIMSYFRAAATDVGHHRAGQGIMPEEYRQKFGRQSSPMSADANPS